MKLPLFVVGLILALTLSPHGEITRVKIDGTTLTRIDHEITIEASPSRVLGLSPADGMEIEFRSDLNDKIIQVVGKKGLTHFDVARLAHTSRTRVTAILNRNTHDILTDLMLRVSIARERTTSNNKALSLYSPRS